MTTVIYSALILIRGTRAVQVLRGFIGLALIIVLLSSIVDLPAFGWLVGRALPTLLLAIPVIFQPELRRALEQLGRTGNYLRFLRRNQENEA
ncbi:MAG: TIGR00159 family protein, partial [Chloroflexi bacterium]|nr:TIGR00159 family protein [Chloroflexota bacterium]